MQPIFLIGYMGCGKTTLARAASRALGLGFVDLDAYIEGRYHMTVSEIFASRGEEEFRRLERQILREVGEFDNVIVACGGGTPCFADNMDYMNSRGTTVWLDASPGRITERLLKARSKRPLIASKTDEEIRLTVDEGLERRRPFYSRAAMTIGADALDDAQQVAGSVAGFARLLDLGEPDLSFLLRQRRHPRR